MFKKVAIIGVGLIGGSLAAAIKAKQLASHIVGIDRCNTVLNQALALNLIDSVAINIDRVIDCDLIVLCIPVAQTQSILHAIYPYLNPNTLITDVGSTKQDVINAAKQILHNPLSPNNPIAQFIPAHPIAGKSEHGPTAADANLYTNKHIIITPLPENSPTNLLKIITLWEKIGGLVSQMSAYEHDKIFSSVSHLPHLLAYALMIHIVQSKDCQDKFNYAGAGFKDFTRIAASNPEMWRDIFIANKTTLLEDLQNYQTVLNTMRTLLIDFDKTELERLLGKAAQARKNLNTTL